VEGCFGVGGCAVFRGSLPMRCGVTVRWGRDISNEYHFALPTLLRRDRGYVVWPKQGTDSLAHKILVLVQSPREPLLTTRQAADPSHRA